MTSVRRTFVTCGFLIASTTLAQAADPVKLRVADSFPKGHYLVKLVLEPWMEQVSKRTNGAVTFEHYPAQQLGKATDMLKLTQTGVADIGYVAPAYASDKMPVSEVAMLPGAFAHSCQGTLAYWKLAKSGVIARAGLCRQQYPAAAGGKPAAIPHLHRQAAGQGCRRRHRPETAFHRRRAGPDAARDRRGAGPDGGARRL